MLVRFWGTRGSLPAPLSLRPYRVKLRQILARAHGHDLSTPELIERFVEDELPFSLSGTFGGNTSCVQIEAGHPEYTLCDLGSGVREFGNRMLAEHGPGTPQIYNIFMSHVHWDHIMGLPFFVPAYIPGNIVRIHGCHPDLGHAFHKQQSQPCFPVNFEDLGATIEFVQLEPEQDYQIGGLTVHATKQHHSGDSYGYRFGDGSRSVVYSTDCEHKLDALDEDYPFVGFFREADLVIFDTMYSLADAVSLKEDWGHSSNIMAVGLCARAGVKHLALFHHEPNYDDFMIAQVLKETRRFEELTRENYQPLRISSAHDGLEIQV